MQSNQRKLIWLKVTAMLSVLAAVLMLSATTYKLTALVWLCLSIAFAMSLPIQYAPREEVARRAKRPLRWWQSPLPYVAFVFVVLMIWFSAR